MSEIKIILPHKEDDDLSDGLVELTHQLRLKTGEDGGFGLGGRDGYGIDYETDVFMMHHFCWCEGEDCRWCGEENAPNFVYKPTGATVHWYKYIGRSQEVSGELPEDWLTQCLSSIWRPGDVWYEYQQGDQPNGIEDIVNGARDGKPTQITLCFCVGDPVATLTLYPTEMAHNNINFWDLDTIVNDALEFGDPEENEIVADRIRELNSKYPALREKIKQDARASHKKNIEWSQRWLDEDLKEK